STVLSMIATNLKPVNKRRSEIRQLNRNKLDPSGNPPKPTRATVTPIPETNEIPTDAAASTGWLRYLTAIRAKITTGGNKVNLVTHRAEPQNLFGLFVISTLQIESNFRLDPLKRQIRADQGALRAPECCLKLRTISQGVRQG